MNKNPTCYEFEVIKTFNNAYKTDKRKMGRMVCCGGKIE